MNITRKEYEKEWRLRNKERTKGYGKKWRLKNKKYIKEYSKVYFLKNKEHISEYGKEYRLKNKEYISEHGKEYRLKNKEHISEYGHNYFLKNKEALRKPRLEYQRNRIRTDPNFRLTRNLRRRIWDAFKGFSKSARTIKLLGCTIEELWQHLESRPTWEPWMTRENYGRSGGWDIDHIKAMTKFDLTDPEQQHACCNWSNLQPMEHIANIKKGNK